VAAASGALTLRYVRAWPRPGATDEPQVRALTGITYVSPNVTCAEWRAAFVLPRADLGSRIKGLGADRPNRWEDMHSGDLAARPQAAERGLS